MRNALTTPLSFEGHALRIERGDDGEPIFHARDLCEILGYSNARAAVIRHVEEGDVCRRDTLTAGGVQAVKFVREPGMWALIFGSETPAARRVKRWVWTDVLPAIRSTGSYQLATVDATPQAAVLREALLEARPDYAVIVRCVRAGLSNAEIGRVLNASRSVVEKRRAKCKRLGLLEGV